MVEVDFHSCNYSDNIPPTYVIVGARYENQWVFVKSRKRGSYEMPAGHIDEEESAFEAAGRELMEETGAKKFVMECISTYSVVHKESRQIGKLFYADVLEMGNIEDQDEIEDRILRTTLPDNLTFPEVQERLFSRLEDFSNAF